MGQNYAKYCHISGMLKDPVETFETSRTYREAIHGPSDFILMVKGKICFKLLPIKKWLSLCGKMAEIAGKNVIRRMNFISD